MNTQERIKDIENYLGSLESTVKPSAGLEVALEVGKMARFLLAERESLSSQVAALETLFSRAIYNLECVVQFCGQAGGEGMYKNILISVKSFLSNLPPSNTAATAQAHDVMKIADGEVAGMKFVRNQMFVESKGLVKPNWFQRVIDITQNKCRDVYLQTKAKAEQAGENGG